MATGARRTARDVARARRRVCTAGARTPGVVDAFTAAATPTTLGRRIAVIDSDGTAYAAGVVLTLLEHVDELELVTPFETVFPHIGAGYDRPLLLERLGAHAGFRRRPSQRVERIEGDDVVIRDAVTGEETLIAATDAIVGIEPRESVVLARVEASRVFVIGDAFSPRTIDAAIFDAVDAAYDVAGITAFRG